MLEQEIIEVTAAPGPVASQRGAGPGLAARPGLRQGVRRLAALTVLLVICFSKPLYELVRYALHSDLYSHVLLIPFISGYLIWIRRQSLPLDSGPRRALAIVPLAAGFAILAGYWMAVRSGWKPAKDDYLAVMMLSFLSLLVSGGFVCLGAQMMRALAFPAAFLIFMVPFPEAVLRGIETFFQHGSADAAYAMLKWSGMPVFRQGLEFQLPGFSMQVAPQCSGIHSSLVLFITSLLAGHLLLQRGWTRAVLVLAVIPLALLRNGFRIFTLGQLCVRVNPDLIHSSIHSHGGPIFFVLSLVPFFLLLIFLRKRESPVRRSRNRS